MIVILKRGATDQQVDRVANTIEQAGFSAHVSRGEERTIIGAIGTSPTRMRPLPMECSKGCRSSTASCRC